jgi:hypothetical protein
MPAPHALTISRTPHFLLAAVLLLAFIASPLASGDEARPAPRFNPDVRPILSNYCFRCHGPDRNQRQAELRLDVRETAVAKRAIVPGKPEESELVRRIFASDPDERMPPASLKKTLTPRERETLREWIASGAEYQPHWAYVALVRPAVPVLSPPGPPEGAAVLSPPGPRPRTPVDAFILEALAARGLQPSPEADPRTLLRRLSLDLTGLPPSPDEMEAFLAARGAGGDDGDAAYAREVERLLASPHYGERMAVPWLDVVRFADTVGYHGDQNQNIFPYRDYVITAFNDNRPFDRFTLEQLAGDLLPEPERTTAALVATGYNRLNMMTREGGAQPGEYLAKHAADRVRTLGAAWLGSTLGCAECHDHKFDPFTTRSFYQFAAFFADVKQWGVYQDYGYTPNPDLRGWTNDHPFPPEMVVESPYLKRRIARLEERLRDLCGSAAAALEADPARRPELEAWRAASLDFQARHPDGWEVPVPAAAANDAKRKRAAFTLEADGSLVLGGKPDEPAVLRLPLAGGRLAAIRVELLPDAAHAGSVVRGGGRNAAVTLAATLQPREGREKKLVFHHAEADRKEERYANGYAIIGVKDVWMTSIAGRGAPQTAVWILDQPLATAAGDVLAMTLGGAVGRARIAVSPFAAGDPLAAGGGAALTAALRQTAAERSGEEGARAAETLIFSTGWDVRALAQAREVMQDIRECRGGRSPTLVTEALEPRPTRVLRRGNWQDEGGEPVAPETPAFLPGPRAGDGRRLTRLDLARWLVSRENPLTARAVMNRLWKQFFGTGLSAVVDDLGAQGEPPSHPELLDWLAVEFIESGWDVKHMVRLLVGSATYRQDSRGRPELAEVDPANRLLAAQSPRRLEAEFVRDNALAIAGLLDREIGGPSAFPYQPAGYYVNLQFPDRDYQPQNDERQYRRGVYTHWQRTFLHPMLANFDAPAREECTAGRTVSNTPQQALTLLNDPTFVEAARVFAARLLAAGPEDDGARLDRAFRRALSRPVKAAERESLLSFLGQERAHFRIHGEEPPLLAQVGIAPASFAAEAAGPAGKPAPVEPSELAAWTSVARVILNLHETITRY